MGHRETCTSKFVDSVNKAKESTKSSLHSNLVSKKNIPPYLYGERSACFSEMMKKYPGNENLDWKIVIQPENAAFQASQVKLSFEKDPVLLDKGRLFFGSSDIMMHLSNDDEKKMIKTFELCLETLNSLACQHVIADCIITPMDAEDIAKYNEDIKEAKEDIEKRLKEALTKYQKALAGKSPRIVELTHFSTISFIRKVFPNGPVSKEVQNIEEWCKKNLKTAG